jgi:hypothetical protein
MGTFCGGQHTVGVQAMGADRNSVERLELESSHVLLLLGLFVRNVRLLHACPTDSSTQAKQLEAHCVPASETVCFLCSEVPQV